MRRWKEVIPSFWRLRVWRHRCQKSNFVQLLTLNVRYFLQIRHSYKSSLRLGIVSWLESCSVLNSFEFNVNFLVQVFQVFLIELWNCLVFEILRVWCFWHFVNDPLLWDCKIFDEPLFLDVNLFTNLSGSGSEDSVSLLSWPYGSDCPRWNDWPLVLVDEFLIHLVSSIYLR